MSGGPEQKIRELVGQLEPVRPIPRLRVWAAAAVGLGIAVAALDWALGGAGPRTDGIWREPSFVAVVFGLTAMAAGAVGAGLASAVPGRDAVVRASWFGLGLGAVLVATTLFGGAVAAGSEARGSLSVPWFCLGRSTWIGVLPALALVGFASRGSVFQPRQTALAAWIGGLALGAVVVHASCRADGFWHVILGHTTGPIALAALLALPGAWWLSRRAASR